MTSGEVYHSSLKNMQVVMLDTWIIFYVRLASLIFCEPTQAATCQQTRATKYNNESNTIVALLVVHVRH